MISNNKNIWYKFDDIVWLSLDKNIDHHYNTEVPKDLVEYFDSKNIYKLSQEGNTLLIGARKALYVANFEYFQYEDIYKLSWWNHFRRKINKSFPNLCSNINNINEKFIIQFTKLDNLPSDIDNKIIDNNLENRFISLNELSVYSVKLFTYDSKKLEDFVEFKIK